jgi:hypothetical protein
MLDRVIAENETTAARTIQEIESALDSCTARAHSAYDRYQGALAELDWAERSESATAYHYSAVASAEAEYERLTQNCSQIRALYSEYTSQVAAYKKSLSADFDEYATLLKKSDAFLSRYAELLGRSQRAIDGDAGGASYAITPSASAGATNSIGSLSSTQQTWVDNGDGTAIFDSPVETGERLDANQGKTPGYQGTCGLVSCVNILRMAGISATEQEVVHFAAYNRLCNTGYPIPEDNGGTTPSDRQAVLANFGINSELRDGSIENIASAISEGRGVIAAFDAGKLWGDPDYYGGGHAVTVTSVKTNSHGKILGFFVCDSGTGGNDSAKYYSAKDIRAALRPGRKINVTSIIR